MSDQDVQVAELEAQIATLEAIFAPSTEAGYAAPSITPDQIMMFITMFKSLLELFKNRNK